jgi:hypothetical protein
VVETAQGRGRDREKAKTRTAKKGSHEGRTKRVLGGPSNSRRVDMTREEEEEEEKKRRRSSSEEDELIYPARHEKNAKQASRNLERVERSNSALSSQSHPNNDNSNALLIVERRATDGNSTEKTLTTTSPPIRASGRPRRRHGATAHKLDRLIYLCSPGVEP